LNEISKPSLKRIPLGYSKATILAFFVAMAAATIFASLPILGFKDRQNYIWYAEYSGTFLIKAFEDSLFSGLMNEPVWLLLNMVLGSFLDSENTVRGFIWFGAFAPFFYVVKKRPRDLLWIMVFAFSSYVLTNHIHHIRLSVAVAVFIVALHIKTPYWRFFWMGVTPFIHSIFFVLLLGYWLAALARRFKQRISILLMSVIAGLLVFVGLSEYLVHGPRQMEVYLEQSIEVRGGAFLAWLVILLAFLSSGKDYVQKYMFEIAIILLYLILYFVFSYPRRFIDAGIYLIVVAGLSLPSKQRYVFIGMMTLLTSRDLLWRFGEPEWGL
jgi:hypothetical protein